MSSDGHAFRVFYRRSGSRWVATVEGELDILTAPKLRKTLERVIEGDGIAEVVIDISRLTFMDSVGYAPISETRQRLEAYGTSVMLRGALPQVDRFLELVGEDVPREAEVRSDG